MQADEATVDILYHIDNNIDNTNLVKRFICDDIGTYDNYVQ